MEKDDLEKALTQGLQSASTHSSNGRLSDREEKFIQIYLDTFSKVEAYRKAYSRPRDLTESLLPEIDALLNKPAVERKLKAELAKRLDTRLSTAPHFLLNYIEEILNLDPRDFYEDDGITVKSLDQIPAEKRKFMRIGKPIVNGRTGDAYPTYEIPSFSSGVDKLLDIVKLVTQLAANKSGQADPANVDEIRERRERILNGIKE